MAFDGTDFVGLDDDIAGDGSSDSRPVDVYLQQRIEGNARNLGGGLNAATCVFRGSDEALNASAPEDRPWTGAISRSYPVCIPFYLETGLEGIATRMLARVADEGSSSNNCQIYPTLTTAPTSGAIRLASVRYALSQGDYAYIEKALDLSAPYTGQNKYGCYRLGVRSVDAGDTTTGITLATSYTGAVNHETTTDGQIANTSTAPASASPDVQYLENDNTGTYYELLAVNENATSVEDVYVFPPVRVIASNNAFSRRWLTYIQCRSMTLHPTYDDTRHTVGVNSLAAGNVVRGDEAVVQSQHAEVIYSRPRMLSWGPPGKRIDQGETWPAGYHTRWPVVKSGASADYEKTLVDDTVTLDFDSGKVEVVLYLIGTVIGPGMFAGTVDGSDGGAWSPAFAEWDITLDVQEFDIIGGAWSDIGTATLSNVPVDHHITTTASKRRFLITKHLSQLTAAGSPNDFFPYREGQLYDEDIDLIMPVTVSVDLSSLTTTQQTGITRLRVSAEYVASSFVGTGLVTDSTISGGEALQITCVGYSAWAFPEL